MINYDENKFSRLMDAVQSKDEKVMRIIKKNLVYQIVVYYDDRLKEKGLDKEQPSPKKQIYIDKCKSMLDILKNNEFDKIIDYLEKGDAVLGKKRTGLSKMISGPPNKREGSLSHHLGLGLVSAAKEYDTEGEKVLDKYILSVQDNPEHMRAYERNRKVKSNETTNETTIDAQCVLREFAEKAFVASNIKSSAGNETSTYRTETKKIRNDNTQGNSDTDNVSNKAQFKNRF